ncbi:MAG: hypothetical protein ACXVJ1_08110, partial [Candidatus Angelobacter sp.]
MSTQPANDVSQTNNSGQKDKKSDSARPIRSAAFWIIIVALLILWLIGWLLHYCVPWIHLLPAVALAAL